jgi:hypothetical protein
MGNTNNFVDDNERRAVIANEWFFDNWIDEVDRYVLVFFDGE